MAGDDAEADGAASHQAAAGELGQRAPESAPAGAAPGKQTRSHRRYGRGTRSPGQANAPTAPEPRASEVDAKASALVTLTVFASVGIQDKGTLTDISLALHELAEALKAHEGELTSAQRQAIETGLHSANEFGRRLGPGPEDRIHKRILVVQWAAQRHGFPIDVASAAILPDGGAKVAADDVRSTLERSERLLERAIGQVEPWVSKKTIGKLEATLRMTRFGLVAAEQGKVGERQRVLALMQGRTLFLASGELDELLAQAMGAGALPGTPEGGRFKEVVVAYVGAMARSRSDTDPLAAARFARQRLPLNLTRTSNKASRDDVDQLAEIDAAAAVDERRALDRVHDRVFRLDKDMHAGRKVSANDLGAVAIESREISFRARVKAMAAQLEDVAAAATNADSGFWAFFANAYNTQIGVVPGALRDIRKVVLNFMSAHQQNVDDASRDVKDSDPERRESRLLTIRMEQLDRTEQHMASFLATNHMQQALASAIREIGEAEGRIAVAKLVGYTTAAIAIGIGAGAVASVAARAVATGTAMALEGTTTAAFAARAASVVGFATRVGVDAGLNTLGQKVLLGDEASLGTIFTSNAAVSLALAPLHGLFARWGAIEATEGRALRVWSTRGKVVMRAGVELSAEMVTGAAVDYAVRRAKQEHVQHLDEQTATQWLIQGASMAVGRFIGGRVTHLEARMASLAESALYSPHQIARVRKLTATLEKRGDAEDAMRAVVEYERLLELEGAVLEAAHASGTIDSKQHARLAGAHDADVAEMHSSAGQALPLRLAGLQPENSSGNVWHGTREQIDDAVSVLTAAHQDVEIIARGDRAAPWKVRQGGRVFELVETAARPRRHEPPRPKHSEEATPAPADGAGSIVAPPEVDPVPIVDAEPPPRVTTAAMVPGSEFRGRSGAGDAEAVKAAAMAGFDEAMRANTAVSALTRAQQADTFIVTTPDGDSFTVRVMTAPLPSEQVARTVINTSKRGKARAADADAAGPSVDIEGRYVIQLSEQLDPRLVERALVHEAREIVVERELARAEKGGRHDRLRPGPQAAGHELSPHDQGRLAELEYLVRISRDPAQAERAQREVLALIDHLGLRAGSDGADERWALVREHLREDARIAVDRLRAGAEQLSADAAQQLAGVRSVAAEDATRAAADAEYRRPLHEMPTAGRPEGAPPMSRDEMRTLARAATAARAARSKSTVAHYRAVAASLNPGEHPVVQSPMIGGGAALGARRPDQLLVDARGRWQEDPSDRIAQTANQLRGLADAGLGDPFQFAKPDERVPMEAIHYWEDSIAVQGEVIDGTGTLRFGDDGAMILEVMPHEGPPPILLRVEGTPVIASGFPKERAPGMAFNKSSTGAALELASALSNIAADAGHPQAAAAAAARDELRTIRGGNEASLAAQVLARHPGLREALKTGASGDLTRALTTLDAYSTWDALRGSDLADGKQHMFLGDEANLKSFDPKVTDDWVIAGTGGTGISAAEIILDNNPKAHVTMVGAGNPEGLMDNDQARRIVLKHGDAASVPEGSPPGDGRLTIKLGHRLGQPKAVKGEHGETRYEAGRDAKTGEVWSGEGYIAALGREGELPPAVLEAARAAFERDRDSVSIAPLHDRDDQYIGYQLEIVDAKGEKRKIDVTGAASRTVPMWLKGAELVDRARRAAEGVDAPPESGNFDGGFVSSATQSARYGHHARSAVTNADQGSFE